MVLHGKFSTKRCKCHDCIEYKIPQALFDTNKNDYNGNDNDQMLFQ